MLIESVSTDLIEWILPYRKQYPLFTKAVGLKKITINWNMIDAMFLFFKGNPGDSGKSDYSLLGGGDLHSGQSKKKTLLQALTGEEQPRSMAGLLLALVCSLHLWGGYWLMQPVEPIQQAQPLMMEVSMVSAPGKQITTAQAAPPKPAEPVKPPKKVAKKPVKKKKKTKPKQVEMPKPLLVPQDLLPEPSPVEAAAEESKDTAINTDTASAPKSSSGTEGEADPYTEASFNANYGINPKPKYPDIARSRGWQGKVLLRVSVSAEGRSLAVLVHRSSGHDVLDESAVAAVEKWKFIPARRGNDAIACTVIVPIIFTLNN